MANAYMMRDDGKLFPVTIHYYAEDIEECFATASWLYTATRFSEVKNLIVKFYAAVAVHEDPDVSPDELVDTLQYYVRHLPYQTAPASFFETIRQPLEQLTDLKQLDLKMLHTAVVDSLNQEFLRVRIGGAYDSERGNRGAYFRVSSKGVNWFNNIWAFVYDNKSQIDSVTVVKDPESTGVNNYYYQIDGQKIDQMPVEDFIMASGRPVIDAINRCAHESDDPHIIKCKHLLLERLNRHELKTICVEGRELK